METISHWFYGGFKEAQFVLIAGFSSLSGVCHLPLDNSPYVLSGMYMSFLLENKRACQPREAWSTLEFPGRWLCWLLTWWNTVDTPSDKGVTQITSGCRKLHSGCQTTWVLVFLHCPYRFRSVFFPNEMQSGLSSKIGILSQQTTGHSFFTLAQLRCFQRCLWFRTWLIQRIWQLLSISWISWMCGGSRISDCRFNKHFLNSLFN